MAEVPAWAAVAIAGLGFAGTLAAAALEKDSERRRQRQERRLHGANERIAALERAITVASAYRERVAMALRELAGPSSDDGFLGEPLWRWEGHDVQVVKSHEAALKLRCGRGPIIERWEELEWELAESAEFCNSNRAYVEDFSKVAPAEVITGANERRARTRKALEDFINAASTAADVGDSG